MNWNDANNLLCVMWGWVEYDCGGKVNYWSTLNSLRPPSHLYQFPNPGLSLFCTSHFEYNSFLLFLLWRNNLLLLYYAYMMVCMYTITRFLDTTTSFAGIAGASETVCTKKTEAELMSGNTRTNKSQKIFSRLMLCCVSLCLCYRH